MEHNSPQSTLNRIGFIGNHLPRQCGIATFTTDLCEAIPAEYSDTPPALPCLSMIPKPVMLTHPAFVLN